VAGWGTALKPAYEPVIVARKKLIGTVAQNVLTHGTGGLNIDGCRIPSGDALGRPYGGGNEIYGKYSMAKGTRTGDELTGRWPANLIHDGSDEVVGLFPQTGASKASNRGSVKIFEQGEGQWIGQSTERGHNDNGGSAARFFYCPKASKKDREGSTHPTIKPTDLMRYLCRLVTPPGGVVLDPFMGSGSTGKAAILEGFRFIGIEREAEYVEIARARIGAVLS
jgi:hypothetical protein